MDKNFWAAHLLAVTMLAGCATLEEGAAEALAETHRTNLTGAQEVGPGDPDGSATAEISVSDEFNQICYDVKDIRNIDTITGMHIHRGRAGTNGPVVLPLTKSNEGTWKGCKGRSEWLEDSIERDFSNYYVNIHTAAYPDGAIRGQLGNRY